MIMFFEGTPGSGKSLHTARCLYMWLKKGKPVICNFDINLSLIKTAKKKEFVFKNNSDLTPAFLIEYAKEYAKAHGGHVKEGSLILVIDECQLLFNSRDWGRGDRSDWLHFFTLHRHLGYDIILVAQFDRMIDRQIRSLIEYTYIHRKVSNFGWKGKFISMFALGNLFVCVKVWYPLKEKVGSEFFRAKKRYYRLYDTYLLFPDSSGS